MSAYTNDNFALSTMAQLATMLRAKGFDIRWYASGEVETQTAGLQTALGQVTITENAPANPTSIVRLNDSGTLSEGSIAVPFFAVRTGQPVRVRRAGLGDTAFEWHRPILIAGFAEDARQQAKLADILEEWVNDLYLKVWDYETDSVNPTELDAAFVVDFDLYAEEITGEEVDTIRYYVRVEFQAMYVA